MIAVGTVLIASGTQAVTVEPRPAPVDGLQSFKPAPLRAPERASYLNADGAIRIIGYNDMQGILARISSLFQRIHPEFRFELILKGTRTAPDALARGTSLLAPSRWATTSSTARTIRVAIRVWRLVTDQRYTLKKARRIWRAFLRGEVLRIAWAAAGFVDTDLSFLGFLELYRTDVGVISRRAYADLLKEAGRPTLIMLDDALVHSDDERLAEMKRVLFDAATRHQILLFSCHPEK